MSSSTSMIGGAILIVLVIGYIVRQYGLPPPAPKIAGVDLGTTFSSIGYYHAVTGITTIIADELGKKSVPSVVAFLPNGTVLVGTRAVEQQEKNPLRTIYDAKRFIGRTFEKNNEQFMADQKRYPFVINLDDLGRAYFEVPLDSGTKKLYPEEIGSIMIAYLRKAAEKHLKAPLKQVVISVPAEFGESQRNVTGKAASLAGMEVRRVISEPTAAALAYGLHKKKGVESVVVVDLGGGTLDVSVLWLQGGVFVTQAMAGNNRLGGQDFNDRVQKRIISKAKLLDEIVLVANSDRKTIRVEIETKKTRHTNLRNITIVPMKLLRSSLLKCGSSGDLSELLHKSYKEKIQQRLFGGIEQPVRSAPAHANPTRTIAEEERCLLSETCIVHGVSIAIAQVLGVVLMAHMIARTYPVQQVGISLPQLSVTQFLYNAQRYSPST
ncbi:unnamed protein product [Cylicocyclus nassatus]|uniref:Uncharacterized protein n=1 Tax=Cylicocyclus nassatus TaxID=53992 RepID=A0AA36HB21_CYLNA|nr:unnamed protein product [Cylicocyclus nassatus]